MAALTSLNFEQAMTLVTVFASMPRAGSGSPTASPLVSRADMTEQDILPQDWTVQDFADLISGAVSDCNDVDGVDWKTAALIIADEIGLTLADPNREHH